MDRTVGLRPQLIAKHILDRAIALLLLVALTPLWLLIALAIRVLDGPPVFFRQSRLGFGGETFQILKFRTMVRDADRLLDDQGLPATSRLTRTGPTLRQWSLDEVPNLWNILAGQMSLVGPRPQVPEMLSRMTPDQRGRFRMRPGLTGLAQIRGRNELAWSERIRLDNYYIENFSMRLDLTILVATVGVVCRRRGLSLDRNSSRVDDLKTQALDSQIQEEHEAG